MFLPHHAEVLNSFFVHVDLSNLLEPNKGPCFRVWASGTGSNGLETAAEFFLSLFMTVIYHVHFISYK
jgi:hypothetical protein